MIIIIIIIIVAANFSFLNLTSPVNQQFILIT